MGLDKASTLQGMGGGTKPSALAHLGGILPGQGRDEVGLQLPRPGGIWGRVWREGTRARTHPRLAPVSQRQEDTHGPLLPLSFRLSYLQTQGTHSLV